MMTRYDDVISTRIFMHCQLMMGGIQLRGFIIHRLIHCSDCFCSACLAHGSRVITITYQSRYDTALYCAGISLGYLDYLYGVSFSDTSTTRTVWGIHTRSDNTTVRYLTLTLLWRI